VQPVCRRYGDSRSHASDPDDDDERLLSAKQLCRRFGSCSDMWIFRRIRDHAFPHPLVIGRLRFWRLGDVRAWERDWLKPQAKPRPRPGGARQKESAA
jgi:predicted DNA-binding transcriptional regulator AlpA